MRVMSLAVLSLVILLAAVPNADAWGGGGKGAGGGAVAGTFSGTCKGNTCSGTVNTGNGSGSYTGTFTLASEPMSALLVGLGLLGARFIRRRR